MIIAANTWGKREICNIETPKLKIHSSTLLQEKRFELEIKSQKIKGQIVRSRMQWLQGEKSSEYLSEH